MQMFQIANENDKNIKLFNFQRFYALFQMFDIFRQLERWKGSTWKEYVVQYA